MGRGRNLYPILNYVDFLGFFRHSFDLCRFSKHGIIHEREDSMRKESVRRYEEECAKDWKERWEKFAKDHQEKSKEVIKAIKCEFVDDLFRIGDTVVPSDYNFPRWRPLK